jgi:tripeptidyl-peptidase-1
MTQDFGHAQHYECTVAAAERLFSTEFYAFAHESGRRIVKHWGEFTLPAHAAPHIDLVLGLSEFPLASIARSMGLKAGVPVLDPVSSRTQYRIPPTASAAGASQAVVSWEPGYFGPDDAATFCDLAGIACTPLPGDHYIGHNDPSNPAIEPTSSMEILASIGGAKADSWFWENNGDSFTYGFAVNLTTWTGPIMTISNTFGFDEDHFCDADPTACQQLGVDSRGYVTKVNSLFMQAGAMGFTLVTDSGVWGTHSPFDPDCTDDHFVPFFPASSPYVTTVGITEPYNAVMQSDPSQLCRLSGLDCVLTSMERAATLDGSDTASGGGFSNFAPMPPYQQAVVANYLKTAPNLPPPSYYNASGRAFPDVSAYGCCYLAIYRDQLGGLTGAAAPTFAGILSLINAEVIKATGKPMGPANPLLYKMQADQPDCFSDITIGNNNCTIAGWPNCSPSCKGFQCTPGWDPVTGLGTPRVDCMLQYVSGMLDKKKKRALAAAKRGADGP